MTSQLKDSLLKNDLVKKFRYNQKHYKNDPTFIENLHLQEANINKRWKSTLEEKIINMNKVDHSSYEFKKARK